MLERKNAQKLTIFLSANLHVYGSIASGKLAQSGDLFGIFNQVIHNLCGRGKTMLRDLIIHSQINL